VNTPRRPRFIKPRVAFVEVKPRERSMIRVTGQLIIVWVTRRSGLVRLEFDLARLGLRLKRETGDALFSVYEFMAPAHRQASSAGGGQLCFGVEVPGRFEGDWRDLLRLAIEGGCEPDTPLASTATRCVK